MVYSGKIYIYNPQYDTGSGIGTINLRGSLEVFSPRAGGFQSK